MIVYHGTNSSFEEFDIDKCELGVHFGTLAAAIDRMSEGLKSDQDMKDARIVTAVLNFKNLYDLGVDLGDWSDMEMLREYLTEVNDGPFTDEEFSWFSTAYDVRHGLMAKGYDGIAYYNAFEGNLEDQSYIVLDPELIDLGESDLDTLEEMLEDKDAYYSIFFDKLDCGPLDGGCFAMAKSLQNILGGELCALHGTSENGFRQAQHIVLKIDDDCFVDADGISSAYELKTNWAKWEFLTDTVIKPFQAGNCEKSPRDWDLIAQVTEHFSRALIGDLSLDMDEDCSLGMR